MCATLMVLVLAMGALSMRASLARTAHVSYHMRIRLFTYIIQ